jgi:hypothetical protein
MVSVSAQSGMHHEVDVAQSNKMLQWLEPGHVNKGYLGAEYSKKYRQCALDRKGRLDSLVEELVIIRPKHTSENGSVSHPDHDIVLFLRGCKVSNECQFGLLITSYLWVLVRLDKIIFDTLIET